MKKQRRDFEPAALELVEEAVHLLRLAPATTLLIYYAGSVPFVLALLYFWAYASWFRPTGAQLAWGALGLVLLFAAMKSAHAEFCRRLYAGRLGGPIAPWSWGRLARGAVVQMRFHPWLLLGGFVASLLAVPLGWMYAYGQNLTVLGDEDCVHDEAVAQAKLWPAQNHLGLLMISLLAAAVWLNLAVAFLAVPWLANKLLGIENIFGFSGWWFLNTTFLAAVTALTWLAVDPLAKAFYVLRVYRGRARRTGDDVRVELQLASRIGRAVRTAVVAVVLVGALSPGLLVAADPPRPRAVQPAELDRAIEGVLQRPEFRWRLRPVENKAAASSEGPVKRFVRQAVDVVVEVARSAGRALRRAVSWIERHLLGERETRSSAAREGGAALTMIRLTLYGFIGAAVLLILWVIWLMVRGARGGATTTLSAQAVAAAAPDLRDENVQAAQLPADGWLALAREQAERGEWRLALRALYLATLARLAGEGLITLAQFKTNLDYEREVRRRSLSRAEIAQRFAQRRREFEDVWYGRGQPGEAAVRAWMAELQGGAS